MTPEPLPIFQSYPILTNIVEFVLVIGLLYWMKTSSD